MDLRSSGIVKLRQVGVNKKKKKLQDVSRHGSHVVCRVFCVVIFPTREICLVPSARGTVLRLHKDKQKVRSHYSLRMMSASGEGRGVGGMVAVE